jgi:FkbM family methyltransferase
MDQDAAGSMTTLSDGRSIHCVNAYEVAFGWHEISSDDLTARGLTFPPGTYVDVGANIGLFCIRLRDLCPEAQIIAYEPMPAAYAALQRNAADLNGDIRAVPLALGAEPGNVTFEQFPGLTALSTANHAVGERLAGGIRSLLSSQGSADIRAILNRTGAYDRMDDAGFVDELLRPEIINATVDTLAHQMECQGIDRIELLKIDTEGSERAVLDGVGPLWPRIRQLMVEVHGGADERDAIAAELRERGYRVTAGDHPMAEGGAAVFHLYAHRP